MKDGLFERVKLLMETMPELRDCDIKLFHCIRREDCAGYGYVFSRMIGSDIEILERQKIISNRDTVTRHRRNIENEFPKLRGINWASRQKQGGQVRKERALSKSGSQNHKEYSAQHYKDWEKSGKGTFFDYLEDLKLINS